MNPATQQIDFYIRSPQQNPKNTPNRDVFLHFFEMEVTWKVILACSREAHMRTIQRAAIVLLVAVAAMTADLRAEQRGDSTLRNPPTVLFMCPHGAAKSVLASTYFEQMAKQRGLNVRVESAGTDPDPAVSPAVAAHLKRQGYPAPQSNPRKVTSKDFESADVVISIGCDLSGLKEPRGKLIRWDEVPPLSEDFTRADDAIRKRVAGLIEELLRSQSKKN